MGIILIILAAVAAGAAGAEGILQGSIPQAAIGFIAYRGMIQVLRVKVAEAHRDLARRKLPK